MSAQYTSRAFERAPTRRNPSSQACDPTWHHLAPEAVTRFVLPRAQTRPVAAAGGTAGRALERAFCQCVVWAKRPPYAKTAALRAAPIVYNGSSQLVYRPRLSRLDLCRGPLATTPPLLILNNNGNQPSHFIAWQQSGASPARPTHPDCMKPVCNGF